MSLKTKVVFVTSLIFVLLLGVTYIVQEQIMTRSFGFLERRYATDDMTRCVRAIQSELEHLSMFCGDWSAWDDTYNYIQGKNDGYITANMMPTTFTTNRLNLICISDCKGRIVWSRACELPSTKALLLAPFTGSKLPAGSKLLDLKTPQSVVKGLVLTERGPILVCSRPILTSNQEGPIRGFLIMGRFLDEARVRELSDQTAVSLKAYPLNGKPLPSEQQAILSSLGPGSPFLYGDRDRTIMSVYTTVPAIDGSPALLLRADVPRAITLQGEAVIRFAALCSIVADALIVFLMWRLLHRVVVDPLIRLTEHVVALSQDHDLSTKLEINSRDEIGSLSHEFNHLVTNLAEFRGKLLDAVHKLRATLDGLRDAVLILDAPAGKILDCNPAAAEIFGVPWTRLIGVPAAQLHLSEAEHERLRGVCGASNGTWKPLERLPIQMRRADGSVFPAEYTLIPISDPNGRWIGWVNVVADLTERQRAESEKMQLREQLFQAQKMEAIGRLASSVSHDFSNFLSVVRGGTDKLRQVLPRDSETQPILNTMTMAATQAAEVARSLLTFARPTANEKEPVNLCEVVEETSDLVRNLLPSAIALLVEPFADDPLTVRANRTQLQQVILNLVINARDAMPDGGIVRLALTRVSGTSSDASSETIQNTDRVALTVSDNGQGMSAETRSHVFESFFTTKSSGSGLGLAIAKGIVKEHGGTIDLQSSPDTGTTFTILLPLVPPPLIEASAETNDIANGDGQTLLLIISQRHVREVTASALESFGYHVLQTTDLSDAVTLLQSHRDEVHLIIADRDELGNGGISTLSLIQSGTRAIPAILLTNGDPPWAGGNPDDNMISIRKPFRLADLAELVKASLHRHEELTVSHG